MEGKTGFFYDIHCHVMNLSHPNFLAFLRRLNYLQNKNFSSFYHRKSCYACLLYT